METSDLLILVGETKEVLLDPGPLFFLLTRLAVFPTSVLQKNLVKYHILSILFKLNCFYSISISFIKKSINLFLRTKN